MAEESLAITDENREKIQRFYKEHKDELAKLGIMSSAEFIKRAVEKYSILCQDECREVMVQDMPSTDDFLRMYEAILRSLSYKRIT